MNCHVPFSERGVSSDGVEGVEDVEDVHRESRGDNVLSAGGNDMFDCLFMSDRLVEAI